MAAITAGIDATISASTAEGQAFQLLQWWQMQEENPSINPNGQEYFIGAKSTDTGNKFFEGTWKIPCTFSSAPIPTLTAGTIYSGLTFTAGTTPGTISAATPTAYTLQLMLWLIARELDTAYNPDRINNITATYNAYEQMIQGTFKLPYTTTLLANGGTQDVARPYLL
jgi:hypothetical protein